MSEQAEYTHDAFISYGHADQEWVWGWLVPRLKKAGLKVCTDRESFDVGVPVVVNIERAVAASRHTLLVLGPAWVESEWEGFAGLLARSEDPVGHRRRTIPLLRGHCTPPRAIARLIYADFTDADDWEQQFERLVATLKGHLHRTNFGPPLGALLGLEAPTNFIFRRNPHFVGREEELAALHDLLDESTPLGVSSALTDPRAVPKVAGLTGLGGIGKTQLAVEYVYRYRDAYPGGIFWINAAEPLTEGLARVGRTLCGNGYDKSRGELIQSAANYLRSDSDTLLVLDNLPDPSLLNLPVDGVVVPATLPCRLLFTTRRRDLSGFRAVVVNTLPPEQALRLLLRHPARQPIIAATHSDYRTAHRICAALGYLPLALELAAAYLDEAEGEVTLAGYLERLGRYGALPTVDDVEDPETVWRESPTWHDPVAMTLASQWDALGDEEARGLLWAAALLPEAETIPAARLSLLAGLSDTAEPGFPSPLAKALRRLHNYSLLEALEAGQVRLHPLVREFAEGMLSDRAGFAAACAVRMADALWEIARLHVEVATRGIDAVLADLHVGLALSPALSPEDRERSSAGGARTTLTTLHRTLDLEAHHLRGWDPKQQPGFFPQQVRNRALELDLTELRTRAEAYLHRGRWPYLRERIKVGRESEALVRTLTGHRNTVNGVAVTPDGRLVISASSDHTLNIWDLSSGEIVRTLAGHTYEVMDVAVTLDGRFAVSASFDRTLIVWDLSSGQAVRTLEGHTHLVNGVAVTPDGRFAVSASWDRTLRIWDLSSGQAVRTLEGHEGWVNGVAVTMDGRFAISASADETLKVWDLRSGQAVRTLEGHASGVLGVTVSPDDRFAISSSSDGALKVWDIATGQSIGTFEGSVNSGHSVAILPGGRFAVFAGIHLRILDLSTGRIIRILKGHSLQVPDLAITPDGRFAISASEDRTLKVWNLTTSEQVAETIEGHNSIVRGLAVTRDGRFAVSAAQDGTLKVWDLSSKKIVRTLEGHTGIVSGVAVTPDGRSAVSASFDRTLKVWDLSRGRTVCTLKGHADDVNSVAVTPDGASAVSASNDRTLRVWDLSRGRAVRTLEGHTDKVSSVAVTPDGHFAISASWDNTLKIWDLRSGQGVRTLALEGHTIFVNSFALTPDGRFGISASADETLKVWDLCSGQAVHTLEGHTDSVNGVAVTSDGRFVVSASWDRTLKVWDLVTGRVVLTLGTGMPLECCAVTPDSGTILAGDDAGAVHFVEWVRGWRG